jgi:hypothetical protein
VIIMNMAFVSGINVIKIIIHCKAGTWTPTEEKRSSIIYAKLENGLSS